MRRLISIAFVVLLVCARRRRARGRQRREREAARPTRSCSTTPSASTEGGDFRVGGVTAGSTTSFEATKDSPPKAEVTVEITEPGFDGFRTDASCNIKPQSLIGEYYVDCQPGTASKKLEDGATVPVEQTESTIPQDLVNNILRRPYRERLRLIINELGTGLAGRPEDLQAGAQARPPRPARDHQGAEDPRRPEPGDRELHQGLGHGGGRAGGAQGRGVALHRRGRRDRRDLRHPARGAAPDLRQAARLPRRAASPRWRASRTWPTSRSRCCGTPAARRPTSNAFLTLLGPFSEASRPAVRSLGEAAEVGARAFEKGANEVKELRALAREAPGHRQAAAPAAGVARRPPPRDRQRPARRGERAPAERPLHQPRQDDRLHRAGVGLELLLLAGPVGQRLRRRRPHAAHQRRRVARAPNGCSPYENDTPQNDPSLAEKFRAVQPVPRPQPAGRLHARLHAGRRTPRRSQREAGKPAKRVGERRKEGQPDAGPVPGQKDISKPQITLPPQLQDLIDQLPKLPKTGTRPARPDPRRARSPLPGLGGQQDDANQLLDFLLAP